jgi:hypothetical protein
VRTARTTRPALTPPLGHTDGPPIDPKPFEALVCVRIDAGTSPEQFAAYLRAEPAVLQAWRVAADIDAVVRLACVSLAELDAAVGRMRHLGGAQQTVTYLVLPPVPSSAPQ